METLLLFAKAPLIGESKTRLARDIGESAALKLSAASLLDTCDVLFEWQQRKVAADQNRKVVIYASPHIEDPLFAEAARRARARVELQVGNTLGERLQHAFTAEFERGARSVCVIGSDSPTLPTHMVDEAFRALMWHRVTVGPTFDGGYWLIGAQRPAPRLFDDIPWSSPTVMHTTLERLRAQGVDASVLPFWYDVDCKADVQRLLWHAACIHAQHAGALSCIRSALEEIGPDLAASGAS